MDWERLYDRADYDRCVYLAGDAMPDLLGEFLDARGRPADLASIGCGPAVTLFTIAERRPEIDCYGYDLSETVVADDEALAAEEGLENLSFSVAELPDLEGIDRRFDLVYCVAVLYFVADAERAVRSLFDLVREGGRLIVTLPTEALREQVRAEFEGRKREAFSLVEAGENLLTPADVERLLGVPTEDYWEIVDPDRERVSAEERERWTTVVAEKPGGADDGPRDA